MPTINGRELQLATVDFTVVVNGSTFTFTSYQGLTLETGRARLLVKDKTGTNCGWTIGDEDTGSGQISGVLLSELFAFKAWLSTVATEKKFCDVTWGATLTYGDSPASTFVDKIEGASFIKDPRSFGSDQQVARVDLPFTAMHVHGHGGDAA